MYMYILNKKVLTKTVSIQDTPKRSAVLYTVQFKSVLIVNLSLEKQSHQK